MTRQDRDAAVAPGAGARTGVAQDQAQGGRDALRLSDVAASTGATPLVVAPPSDVALPAATALSRDDAASQRDELPTLLTPPALPALLNQPIHAVVIDSRQAGPDDLFVALPGARTDGALFAGEVYARAAAAILTHIAPRITPEQHATRRAVLGADVPFLALVTPDPLAALQAAAASWRRRCADVAVVGVTGSVGKTTTREAIAALLATAMAAPVLAAERSYNNEIGLPLTLLRLRPAHRAAVLEMGMYARGEIAELASLAQPRIGVVTMVAPVHLERLGSLEAIAAAKAELVEALPPDGTAVLNGDDDRVRAMAGLTTARTVRFGLAPGNDWRAADIEDRGLDGLAFTLVHASHSIVGGAGVPDPGSAGVSPVPDPGSAGVSPVPTPVLSRPPEMPRADHSALAVAQESGPSPDGDPHGAVRRARIETALVGRHVLYALLAASAVADALDVPFDRIAAALGAIRLAERQRLVDAPEGRLVIDDAWNASPPSMLAALDVLARVPRRRVAVLGEMRELGAESESGHRAVGRRAGEVLHALVAVGPGGVILAEEARAAGLPEEATAVVADGDGVPAALATLLQHGDAVLVKGSRALRLEDTVEWLMAPRPPLPQAGPHPSPARGRGAGSEDHLEDEG